MEQGLTGRVSLRCARQKNLNASGEPKDLPVPSKTQIRPSLSFATSNSIWTKPIMSHTRYFNEATENRDNRFYKDSGPMCTRAAGTPFVKLGELTAIDDKYLTKDRTLNTIWTPFRNSVWITQVRCRTFATESAAASLSYAVAVTRLPRVTVDS